ncbi:PREDICTED: centrosomal protein of 55 kDa [Elephantulus edwardii]|uniref:centrosomal protein of 55 kDa n=1 Tax=Elephantulus edwardii TaxID=28737 RepID=UPI0003F0DA12|nr:PREDICTED: centrosomal protein of 55 kDa [Elephantulus edwardii]
MSSRIPKDFFKSKWKPKASNSKPETAFEKFKEEIAALKTSVEEITNGKGKLVDKDRHKLIEKIRHLEAEREKNASLLTEKDREIQRLRDQLKVRYSSAALLEQLEEKTKECERREQLLKSLSEETDALKNHLSTTTARLAEFQSKASMHQFPQASATSCFSSSVSNTHEMEVQLKDALEKNQQWLVYDQQREAYVRGLLARISELEQQLETAAQSLPQEKKRTESEGYLQEEKQKYYSYLLANAKKDLEVERQTVTQLNFELSEFRRKKELHDFPFTEPQGTFQGESENKLKVASPKSPASLNDSLVECPRCNIQYPATEHRDLLAHVEYCAK